MTHQYTRHFILLVASIFIATFIAIAGKPTSASPAVNSPPLQTTAPESATQSCRYGTSAVGPYAGFVQEMGIGWTLAFGASPGQQVPGAEPVPTVRIKQQWSGSTRLPNYEMTSPPSLAELANLVKSYPGRIWQVGNEVDRVYWQDDIMPQIYAKAYHDIYHVIKANDPTALVTPSALVEVTPGRLQYLDIVWNTYLATYKTPMPVDLWNMHVYILPEAQYKRDTNGNVVLDGNGNPVLEGSRAGIALGTGIDLAIRYSEGDPAACSRGDVYCYAEHDDINIFKQQVIAMRQWMKARGHQNKPLIMTEFGTLYPFKEPTDPDCPECYSLQDEFGNTFNPQRVTAFMNATLNFLNQTTDPALGYPEDNYRLVQQWNWYAVNDGFIVSSNNLVKDDGSGLTLMGQTYKNRSQASGYAVNLRLSEAPGAVAWSSGGTASAQISAVVRNNGNAATQNQFQVTFYSDAARTVPIGSVNIPAGVTGCATRAYTASVMWGGLTPGVHRYWVTVDSTNAVAETTKADNTGTGVVIVDPRQVLLPSITR